MAEPRQSKSAPRRLAEDYSSTAAEYARMWGPVIFPMGLPLLDALPLRNAGRILDLGTGVGAFLPRLRAAAPDAHVLGVDSSEGMLRIGRAAGEDSLCATDAAHLALRSRSSDVALLVFMLFHLPDPLAGLVEAARVLRPDGSLGLTTWAFEPGLPGATIWTEELDALGAGPDTRDASVRQHELMDSSEKVTHLLEAAGFGAIEVWTQQFERRWDRDSLLPLQQACSGSGRRLSTLSSEIRAECVSRVRARMPDMSPDELVWRPEILFAVARTRR